MNDLQLYYYDYPNFGDQLGKLLLSEIFHCDVNVSPYTTANVVAIGSILDALFDGTTTPRSLAAIRSQADATQPIHVWGTGMMWQYETPIKPLRPLEIYALRGPLTKMQVEKSLGIPLTCTLADPGLLAPLLLKEKPVKQYRVGIVPHYAEKEEKLLEKMQTFYSNSVIIDVQKDTRSVIRQIAECEVIFSTSLHGLIVADSFGIPSQWCKLTDKILGNDYKYHDYYQSLGIDRNPLILTEDVWPSSETVEKRNDTPFEIILEKQQALIDAGLRMLRDINFLG